MHLASLDHSAALNSNAIALSSDELELTYADLNARSNQLARFLQTHGAGREVLVAICLPRSFEFVVAALAILKSGAAYLPLDPTHPPDRLRRIAADSGARVIVTNHQLASHFSASNPVLINLDAAHEEIAQQSTQPLDCAIAPEDLAYVIYTSGSTGEPKGVELTHGNLDNLIAWHLRAFAVDASAHTTFQAGVGFDAAVWEIWPTLCAGAQLHLPDNETRLSPEALRDWLVAKQITHSFVPTAMAEQLIGLPWPNETSLRFLLTGADTLHRFAASKLPFQLINNYGPTECTVVATSGAVPANGEGVPSIGAPIDRVSIQIIDDEIHIGGAGVARGYRNRPKLTEERFVRLNRERFYRSGDLGRFRANGEIDFLGRRDDQIKIRGYRIELNEINSILNQHPSVRASVVIAREDLPNEKKLVAYVVPAHSFYDEQALREALAQRLPDYMVPVAFVWLESLPLNANGKIDRAALPAPSLPETNFTAPSSPVEETLTAIIAEVLKVPRLSLHDDFFHLGAHSLLGAQIIAKVREAFGVELKLLDVFDAPTVAQLSVKIEDALTAKLNAMSEADVEAALAQFDNVQR